MCDLGDDVLELRLPPGLGGVGHDGQDGVVKLVVLVVQEHELGPQVGLLGSAEYLGNGREINAENQEAKNSMYMTNVLPIFYHQKKVSDFFINKKKN